MSLLFHWVTCNNLFGFLIFSALLIKIRSFKFRFDEILCQSSNVKRSKKPTLDVTFKLSMTPLTTLHDCLRVEDNTFSHSVKITYFLWEMRWLFFLFSPVYISSVQKYIKVYNHWVPGRSVGWASAEHRLKIRFIIDFCFSCFMPVISVKHELQRKQKGTVSNFVICVSLEYYTFFNHSRLCWAAMFKLFC